MATGTRQRNRNDNSGIRTDGLSPDELQLLERLRRGELELVTPGQEDVGDDDLPPDYDGDFPKVELHSHGLSEKQLNSVRSGRGRRTEPSEYLPDVMIAQQHPGEFRAFDITTTRTSAYIIGQLRRACRAQGLESKRFSIYNREKEGFVAFVIHKKT